MLREVLDEATEILIGLILPSSDKTKWPKVVAYDGDNKVQLYFKTEEGLRDFLEQFRAKCKDCLTIAFPEGHKFSDLASFTNIKVKRDRPLEVRRKQLVTGKVREGLERLKVPEGWTWDSNGARGQILVKNDRQCFVLANIGGDAARGFSIKGEIKACEPLGIGKEEFEEAIGAARTVVVGLSFS